MSNLHILASVLSINVLVFGWCVWRVATGRAEELTAILGAIALVGLPIFGVLTWDSYLYSQLEDCVVGTQNQVYWIDSDHNEIKTSWVRIDAHRFCKLKDTAPFYLGIDSYLNGTYVGKVDVR